MTPEQLAVLRTYVGEDVSEDELAERFDRLGAIPAVALEVQRAKLSAVLNAPAGFSIPGVYSEDNGARIKGLQDSVAQLQALVDSGGELAAEGATVVRRRARPRTSR